MGYRDRYSRFAPYVPVAERRKKAAKKIAALKKQGQDVRPVVIEGRLIAKTFWGQSWCKNLESYSDFENRLPRGRTYVRKGSVINLQLSGGKAEAVVSGSSIYYIDIGFEPMAKTKWQSLVKECSGKIDSLIELLQGKFSKGVMQVITEPGKGLFPNPEEIKLSCSCPDYADMCKHVAAVLYGIGARLDQRPEELFLLRQADHKDLIANLGPATLAEASTITLANDDLSSLFGIQIEGETPAAKAKKKTKDKETKPKASAKKRAPTANW